MNMRDNTPMTAPGAFAPPAVRRPPCRVRVEHDLVYGHGVVGWSSPAPTLRPLALDLYMPEDKGGTAPRPLLLLAFGGAFHRGSKEDDSFEAEGGNTAMAEYCMRFARRGYVTCSIDYRLVPEDPGPGDTPVVADAARIPTARVDVVRGIMGLPPATPEMLWRGIEAASDDMATAIAFVRAHAAQWNIDPERIAVGGFSAGGRTALNAALGEKAGVAAVVALSGYIDADDLARHAPAGARGPAVLLINGENDLPYLADAAPGMVAGLRAAGLHCVHATVPEAGHFYRAEALALPDGGGAATTVEQAIAAFLDRALALPPDVAMLESFAAAWNRHDIDALMDHMTEDCVFHASFGPEACGMRHAGAEAVRAGFARAWQDFPDAQWRHARHFVAGDRGVSEWTFTGTRASDGLRVEVDGCDIFTFARGRIRVKNSWRKMRNAAPAR